MKAISLWQPWATLIACGAKPYETRSFAPPASLIGQSIAIHAAKKIDKGAAQFAEELMYGQHKGGGFDLADRLEVTMSGIPDELMGIFRQTTLPIGCVVAIARLDAAFQLGNPAHGTALPAATVVKRLTSRPMPECFTSWGFAALEACAAGVIERSRRARYESGADRHYPSCWRRQLMTSITRRLFLSLAAALAPGAAIAHHGWGGYDTSKSFTVTGKILKSTYENPHCEIEMEVDGKHWRFVLAPPSRMERRGITPDIIAAGKTCTVFGHPHTSNPDEARIEYIIVDGKRVELR